MLLQMNNKLVIIGASGMLGSSLLRYLSKVQHFKVIGTVRSREAESLLRAQGCFDIRVGVDVLQFESVAALIEDEKPDYVINCVGVIKQLDQAKAPLPSIEINSLLPHKLADICDKHGAQLIHFSTDCVFSGQLGAYVESNTPDASDLYGRSKLLGEVSYGGHLTLRTSIIGHEINKSLSLIDWFLSQKQAVKGFRKAIFSGLPTVYVAEFLKDFVIGHSVQGLYHLSVDPIDKFSLLSLVKRNYQVETEIREDDSFVIDRSLDSSRLREAVGFVPPSWEELVKKMREEYREYFE